MGTVVQHWSVGSAEVGGDSSLEAVDHARSVADAMASVVGRMKVFASTAATKKLRKEFTEAARALAPEAPWYQALLQDVEQGAQRHGLQGEWRCVVGGREFWVMPCFATDCGHVDKSLRERLFGAGVCKLESLMEGGLELTATALWLRGIADKIACHEVTEIQGLTTDTERIAWAVEQAPSWMPQTDEVAELVRMCAEWRVWEMGDIRHTEGSFGLVAYDYVREVTWRVLVAMADEVAYSVA